MTGKAYSLADIFVATKVARAFQTVLDAGFRKAMPYLTKWFDRVCLQPTFIHRNGIIYPCAKALKSDGSVPDFVAPMQASNKKALPPKKSEDFDDLFGEVNEDEEKAAKEAADKVKAAKKPKKVVIAQSLVLFEVKPLDDTTDLDAMAQKILGITMDGLYWKTEYKKEPVAFGIFKLIIGVTVEDEKVSVDALQE